MLLQQFKTHFLNVYEHNMGNIGSESVAFLILFCKILIWSQLLVWLCDFMLGGNNRFFYFSPLCNIKLGKNNSCWFDFSPLCNFKLGRNQRCKKRQIWLIYLSGMCRAELFPAGRGRARTKIRGAGRRWKSAGRGGAKERVNPLIQKSTKVRKLLWRYL